MPKPLAEYAQGYRFSTCTICNSPDEVRMQVEANERAPKHSRIPRQLVVSWSKQEFDHDISVDSIYRHMRDHLREA